jgi:salicylate hydroxylase
LYTNKCCVNLDDRGSIVRLNFKDGSSAEANMVIGCDGIHSNIRAQFVKDQPVYSGIIAYRGVIPMSTLGPWKFPSYSVLWMGKRRHFLVFTISANASLNIVAFVTKDETEVEDLRESWTSTCPREELERDFEGFEETVQHIIRQMPDPASKWKINYREPLDQWTHMDGKVILVGDSAHPMTPHQGAGGGQAVEDGYILSKCLAEFLSPNNQHCLDSWMQLYQAVRLPRAQKVARTSKVAGETYEQTAEDLKELSYDEGLHIVRERVENRMRWVWNEDLDVAFDRIKQERGL